jgi:hypothetical protein
MPVLYEDYNDKTDVAVGIAKELFGDYDFNAGQQSIIDSATYQGRVIQHVIYRIQGDTWEVTSEIAEYSLDIQVSHPEAVDQSLSKVKEDTKSYIFDLFDSVDYAEKGGLIDLTSQRNSGYKGIMRKIGLFI